MINLSIGVVCLAVCAAAVLFAPGFAKIRLPVAVFILAYGCTTVIGAALLLDAPGRAELVKHFDGFSPASMATLGGSLYWAVLLVPLVLVPAAAWMGARAGDLTAGDRFRAILDRTDIPTPIVYALLAGLSGVCFYKLWTADALLPLAAFDRSLCFDDKMVRRVELIALLGNQFYAFAYSSIPVVSTLFLAKFVLGRERASLVGFLLSAGIALWLYLAMIMKAPFIIFFGMIALTLIFCGVGIVRAALLTVPAAVAAFAILSAAQYCPPDHARWKSEPLKPIPSDLPGFVAYTARGVLFRMAQAYPYYIELFSRPAERCGIEAPHLPFVGRQSCFPAVKVFREMYPDITKVTGYAPAPVHVSGLAEAGPVYAVVVTILCGLILGALATLAHGARSPPKAAAGVIACIYAYYASQVSFMGTLTDGYGLIWLVLPWAVILPFARRAPAAAMPAQVQAEARLA